MVSTTAKRNVGRIGKIIVRGFKTHDEVINFDKTRNVGLNVVSHNKYATNGRFFASG